MTIPYNRNAVVHLWIDKKHIENGNINNPQSHPIALALLGKGCDFAFYDVQNKEAEFKFGHHCYRICFGLYLENFDKDVAQFGVNSREIKYNTSKEQYGVDIYLDCEKSEIVDLYSI